MSGIRFPEYLQRAQNTLNEVVAGDHYQDVTTQMIFRYDNAAHRPTLSAREHKHTPDNTVVMLPPTLEQVIDEILKDQDSSRGR